MFTTRTESMRAASLRALRVGQGAARCFSRERQGLALRREIVAAIGD
jgi:hypothetical protein